VAYEPLTGFHGQGARLGGIEFVAPKRERASGAFPHALPGPIPLWASKRDWLRGFGCQNGSPAARNQSHLARSFHRPPIQKLPTQERERERERVGNLYICESKPASVGESESSWNSNRQL